MKQHYNELMKIRTMVSSLLFSYLLFYSTFLIAQDVDQIDGSGYCGTPNPSGSNILLAPTCDVNLSLIPNKTVRLTVHVFLKSDGTGNIPDNATGRNWINTVVQDAKMFDLAQMNIAGPSPYIQDSKIRFQIMNTYFWKSDAMWAKGNNTFSNINALKTFVQSQNIPFFTTSIQLFFPGDFATDGLANQGIASSSEQAALLEDTYHDYSAVPWRPWEVIPTVRHEVGHVLSLDHSWSGDGLDDTPDNCNCWAEYQGCSGGSSTCPCGNSNSICTPMTVVSNNLMDYNSCACAMTLDQASKMHSYLQNTKPNLVSSGLYAPALNGTVNSSGYNGPLQCCTMNVGAAKASVSGINSAGASSFTWTKTGGSGSFNTLSNGSILNLSGLGSINMRVDWTANCHNISRTYTFFNGSSFFLLGPNPTTGDVFLEVINQEEFLELATEMTGKLVPNALDECMLYGKGGEMVWNQKHIKESRLTIPMGKLETGTYMLITKTGDLVLEHKLLKI